MSACQDRWTDWHHFCPSEFYPEQSEYAGVASLRECNEDKGELPKAQLMWKKGRGRGAPL